MRHRNQGSGSRLRDEKLSMLGFRYQYLAGFGELREKFHVSGFCRFYRSLEVLIVVHAGF